MPKAIETWQLAILGILALVPTLAMMPVGGWLSARFSQKGFDNAVLALLGIIAAQLLVQHL